MQVVCVRIASEGHHLCRQQLTLNQRVQGSNPCAPTTKKAKEINKLTKKILAQVVASGRPSVMW
jgi:hypothetical protein